MPMSTPFLLELFAGFLAASIALWFVVLNRRTAPAGSPPAAAPTLPLATAIAGYFRRHGTPASLGLLLLRLAIGAMMIHHGQDKLADPQTFASNYVVPLHLPFPLFFACLAGYAEIFGSWMLILGLGTPLGALALTGTMVVAAYHHILTSGLNIYVLELVVLYLGGSLAILLLGPGRFSFDAAIVSDLLDRDAASSGSDAGVGASPQLQPSR